MIIPVHMFAFHNDRNTVRKVNIPDYELSTILKMSTKNLLEIVFEYGQNEFQPQNVCSVSVGDVAEVDGEYYLCGSIGWDRISKEEFEGLKPPTAMYGMMGAMRK